MIYTFIFFCLHSLPPITSFQSFFNPTGFPKHTSTPTYIDALKLEPPHFTFSILKMGRTIGTETSAFAHIKTPGNYPRQDKLHTPNHGICLNFNNNFITPICYQAPQSVSPQLIFVDISLCHTHTHTHTHTHSRTLLHEWYNTQQLHENIHVDSAIRTRDQSIPAAAEQRLTAYGHRHRPLTSDSPPNINFNVNIELWRHRFHFESRALDAS
jgi:hypothetical protein